MRKIFTLLAWSALGALAAGVGCSNSTNEQNIATEASHKGGYDDAGAAGDAENSGAIEFTTFVRQLIETQTAENNLPTTIDDKTFVDSQNPDAFPPAFFRQQ